VNKDNLIFFENNKKIIKIKIKGFIDLKNNNIVVKLITSKILKVFSKFVSIHIHIKANKIINKNLNISLFDRKLFIFL
tara:strand:- start:188 stop:421 length:234 start_codon:yes stop_codon:yes gene_type:complete